MSNQKIPKNIFITLNDKNILNCDTNKITIIIKKIKKEYPEYKVNIYDDKESYELVKNYNDNLLLNCYEEILPAAFKADIFRLVVLIKFGGIYIDTGIFPNPKYFKPLLKDKELLLCEDRAGHFPGYKIYNAIIASVKDHIFLKNALNTIKNNISHFNYGISMLDITGPCTLGTLCNEMYHTEKADKNRSYNEYNFKLEMNKAKNVCIGLKVNHDLSISDCQNNKVCDPKIRDFLGAEKIISKECNHYSFLWNNKLVFFQLVNSSWHLSAQNFYLDGDGYLCADLKDFHGNWKFSRIKYMNNTKYDNIDGSFKMII